MRRRPVAVLLPILLALGLFGGWAGTAMSQLPPTPTVSVPSVTVPSVPTVPPAPLPPPPPAPVPPPPPTPPAPSVPTPRVEVPKVETPRAPVEVPVQVPNPTSTPGTSSPSSGGEGSTPTGSGPSGSYGAQAGSGSGGSGGAGAGAAGGTRTAAGASSRIRTVVTNVRTSRKWIAAKGPRRTRGVTITFWLSRRATLLVLVDEVAPDCRFAGHFLVRGRPGLNVVRFNGRIKKRALDAGTYRLTVHPRGQRARRLARTTVVVLERPPRAREVAAARTRNTCPRGELPSTAALANATGARDGAGTSGTSGTDGAAVQTSAKSPAGVAGVQATSPSPRRGIGRVTGPVASAVDTIEEAAEAIPPVLYALAALAVLLLGIASMPQPVRASRTGAALVHHRGTIALAGVGVLVTAVVAFLVL